MQDDDTILVQRCLNGERDAFGVIVDRYQKVVFNAAFRILNDREDASDITQAVFLKAFENLKSYNGNFRFFSWLYRIAVNESLNFQKQRSRTGLVDEEISSLEKGPEELLQDIELGEQVQSALMTLSVDYRTVIVLNHFHGLSYKEIGFVLDMPEKTVKSRLFTARQLLKECLLRKGYVSHE